MRSSYHYNLNLVEGSDLVNPLVQDVPNYEAIDNQMYDNAVASIGLATELKSGTVHALTRSNPDAPMFRFVATSRYDEGDTFTVDGIQVSGLLTDGTTLSDGAYAINANVLCCLVGSVLTLFTVPGAIQTAQNALKLGGELPNYYGKASDVQTALNTANAAGLLANSASEAVAELSGKIGTLGEYSPIEHKVGKWIDGSDVYEKTVTLNITNRASSGQRYRFSTTHTLGAKNLISIDGEAVMSEGTHFMFGDSHMNTNLTMALGSGASLNPSGNLVVTVDTDNVVYTSVDIVLTVRYTKL